MKQYFRISHFHPWQTRKDKKRKQEKFSSKYTHNGIGILSWRKGKKGKFKQSSNKCTKQSWNRLGFARLSFGKRKGGAMKSVNIHRTGRRRLLSGSSISWEFSSESISSSPLFCLFNAVTAINTIQRYTGKTTCKGKSRERNEKQALCRRNFS